MAENNENNGEVQEDGIEEVDSSEKNGTLNVDQVIGMLSTKRNPEKEYQKLKSKGLIEDPDATEKILRDMGWDV